MSAGKFAARWGRGDRAAGRSTVEAELIRRLRALPGPTPQTQFKADLRAQLVAITARVVSESAAETTPASASASRRSAGSRALRTLRRPALALAGASTVLVLLLGMAVWMSSGSLPGQSLYGVKRASENVQLSMAGNDVAKGEAYLELADHRMREVADLLSQPSAMLAAGGVSAAGGRVNPRTASLVADTLDSADADSVNAMRLLGRAAVAQLSKEPLAKVSSWLPPHRTLMTEVRDRIPAGPLKTRAQASLLLLQRIATRTGQLSSAMGCACLAQALADELGPVPCSDCDPVITQAPGRPAIPPASQPAPVPGLGSPTGPSGSLPSLSLPPLGGSGGSSSGHAVGPSAPQPTPSRLPSSLAGSSAAASSAAPTSAAPLPSIGPAGPLGPILSRSASVPGALPGSLPGPLPGPLGSSNVASVLPSLPGVTRP